MSLSYYECLYWKSIISKTMLYICSWLFLIPGCGATLVTAIVKAIIAKVNIAIVIAIIFIAIIAINMI